MKILSHILELNKNASTKIICKPKTKTTTSISTNVYYKKNKKFIKNKNRFNNMLTQKRWNRDFRETNKNKDEKIKSIATSLNGKFILIGFEETLQVLDSTNGKTLNQIQSSHKKGILNIVISKYGNFFITIGGDNKVILWDGSELAPKKKFSLNSKTTAIKFAGFNDNETTAFIISSNELVIFKTKCRGDEKELRKIKIKDRTIEGAAFIESLSMIITADSLNFIALYDTKNLQRINLSQKLFSVNAIKCFDDKIWLLFSNNSLVVYSVEDSEVKFEVLEKKTPFEILDVLKINENLFLAVGFSSNVALLNGEGHFLKDLLSFEQCSLIRRVTFHKESSLFTIATDFYNISNFKLQERPEIFLIDNLWIKVKNLCQLELSLYNEENSGIEDVSKNHMIDIQGCVQSIGYNKNSFLAVLSKSNNVQKIKLLESNSVLRNMNENEWETNSEDIDNFEKLLSDKQNNLKLDFFEDPEKVFCTTTFLIFKLQKALILTDFKLNILKNWNFNHKINFIEIYPCLKRKESAIVALENGEIIKVNFDNPFPVTIIDYKLSIVFFDFNLTREKIMILDKNLNFNLYHFNPETISTTQLISYASILSTGFNKSNPDLYFTLSSENILTVKYKADKFLTIHNFLNLENEKIILFKKSYFLIKNLENNYVRLAEISISTINNELIKEKNYKESLDLLLSVDPNNQEEFKKLAVSSFADLSPFALEAIKYTNDGQLLHLAEEFFKKSNKNEKTDQIVEKLKIKAEMLSYEGKFNSAVELLLNEKQILETLEILIILGKYEKAIKILKNPNYQRNLNSSKYDISSLIRLQANEAKNNGEENLALELFKSIKDNEEVTKILIKNNKEQDLINFVRTVDMNQSGKKSIKLAYVFFKEKNNISYAKECLIKLDEKMELLDLYIETEMFENALILYDSLKNEKIIEPERIYIPYAAFLMRENRFEEALENYKKIEKFDLCLKMLQKFIFINLNVRNYLLVSVFLFESFKLQNTTIEFGLDSFLFLFLHQFTFFKNYSFFSEKNTFIHKLNLLTLVLNLMKNSEMDIPFDFLENLNSIIQKAFSLKLYNYVTFLIDSLKKLDSKKDYISKWSFFKNICLQKKTLSSGSLYKCYQCNNEGFDCSELTCSECGIKLFFCCLTGSQIPLIEIKFEESVKSETYLSLENYKNFHSSSNDNNHDVFKEILKKNYDYQRDKGVLMINSENILRRINFYNFVEFEENRFFYKYDYCNFLICHLCGVFYCLELFEEFSTNDCCLICKKNEFSFY